MPAPASTTVVLMGVSGVGKSTVAAALVERTGWDVAEGDDLHPEANRAKMAAGHPLDDADRAPWLRLVADWIGGREAAGHSAVVTCSALRRRYRDVLVDGHPSVLFVHLVAPRPVLARRLEERRGHYMPPTLLPSQIDTLEPLADDEPGMTISATDDAAATATAVLAALEPHTHPAGGDR